MPYVRRDGGGAIDGCFGLLQPGIAEEWLDETNPEVVAFRNPLKPSIGDTVENGIVSDPILIAFVRRTATKEGITERELLDEICAEAREVVRL